MPSRVNNDDERQPYRCILWGGYGWGNVGDELNLAVALQDMKTRYGNSLAILTRSPGYTRRLFPDYDTIAYEPLRPADPTSDYIVDDQLSSTHWAKQIAACEALYLVGGGYLSDLFFVNWTLLPVFVARLCGVKIATAPIGLGPFATDWWAKRVAEVLESANLVVRDDESVKYCRRHGLTAKRQEDDGFRLDEVLQIARPRQTRQGLLARFRQGSQPKRIGVNIFCQHGSSRHDDSQSWWAELLGHLSNENTIVEGFCFHNSVFEDLAVTTECFHRAGLDHNNVRFPDHDFRVACNRLAEFDAIVSSRFHAIVVGNAIGIRTFAVCDGEYYCRKMEAATKKFEFSTLVRQLDCAPRQTAANILQDGHVKSSKVDAA